MTRRQRDGLSCKLQHRMNSIHGANISSLQSLQSACEDWGTFKNSRGCDVADCQERREDKKVTSLNLSKWK